MFIKRILERLNFLDKENNTEIYENTVYNLLSDVKIKVKLNYLLEKINEIDTFDWNSHYKRY